MTTRAALAEYPEALAAGLAALRDAGVELSDGVESKLLAFVDLLQKWNRVYNLTAIREPAKMVSHHLLDSLAVLTALPLVRGARVLDVGSGAGLPGIPLAVARPEARFTLLDSNAKKVAFLAQARIELALGNVEVVSSRVEDFQPDQKFDVIVSRAFSEVADFARLAAHLLGPGGELVAMKGVVPHEELAAVPSDFRVRLDTLRVSGLDAQRCLVRLRRAE